MQITITGKNDKYFNSNDLTRGMKSAITRKVRAAGFDTEWQGNSIVVTGAYYGQAVEAINELGYMTDEDEIEE